MIEVLPVGDYNVTDGVYTTYYNGCEVVYSGDMMSMFVRSTRYTDPNDRNKNQRKEFSIEWPNQELLTRKMEKDTLILNER